MVSTTFLTFLDESSHQCNNRAKKSGSLARAVKSALHVRKKGLPVTVKREKGRLQTAWSCKVRFPGLEARH